MQKQAGAIVFRESYEGYVPLGVWLVRQSAREALKAAPKEFETKDAALNYVSTKLWLPFLRYRKQSVLLKKSTLVNFAK